MEETEKLLKLPKFFFKKPILQFLLNTKYVVVFCVLAVGYSIYKVKTGSSPNLVGASEGLVIVFGFLLTIKHNFIADTESLKNAIEKHFRMGKTSSVDMEEDPIFVNPTIRAIKDEYLGIFLVVIGTILSSYGSIWFA